MKASEDIPKLIVDPKAETALELVKATGRSRSWVDNLCKEMVDAGRWERVWKKVGPRLAPAYRTRGKR